VTLPAVGLLIDARSDVDGTTLAEQSAVSNFSYFMGAPGTPAPLLADPQFPFRRRRLSGSNQAHIMALLVSGVHWQDYDLNFRIDGTAFRLHPDQQRWVSTIPCQ